MKLEQIILLKYFLLLSIKLAVLSANEGKSMNWMWQIGPK